MFSLILNRKQSKQTFELKPGRQQSTSPGGGKTGLAFQLSPLSAAWLALSGPVTLSTNQEKSLYFLTVKLQNWCRYYLWNHVTVSRTQQVFPCLVSHGSGDYSLNWKIDKDGCRVPSIWREPGKSRWARWVAKADPKTDAGWQWLRQPWLWMGHSLVDPSAKWDGATQWSWWGWGAGNDTEVREREEGRSFEGSAIGGAGKRGSSGRKRK